MTATWRWWCSFVIRLETVIPNPLNFGKIVEEFFGKLVRSDAGVVKVGIVVERFVGIGLDVRKLLYRYI